MKRTHILSAAFALSLATPGLAFAQGAAPATPNTPTPAGSSATTTPPANASLGHNAQSTPDNNAVNTAPQNNPGAPIPGANSFTEGEARSRIQDHGFSQVADLKLDNQGIWRGTASKNGQKVNVALDYQGNVVQQ